MQLYTDVLVQFKKLERLIMNDLLKVNICKILVQMTNFKLSAIFLTQREVTTDRAVAMLKIAVVDCCFESHD
jgi:hypothetical protein